MSASFSPAKMTTRVPLVYGASAFGAPGSFVARIHDLSECQKCIDSFVDRGHKVFDSSRVYGDGTSEHYLAKLNLKGSRVDTKCAPMSPGDHSPEKLASTLRQSVKALSPLKIRVFYLHAPDRSVPFEDTLRAVDGLYKEGLFEEFGLSNFQSWEVAEIVTIAKLKNWIKPTIYQGLYNAIERSAEAELFPCLRRHGLRFYAYSPLAHGLLAGTNIEAPAAGSRWDVSASTMAPLLRMRYKGYEAVFQELGEALAKHNTTLSAAALRWLQHHSSLTPEDGVIVGASSLPQLQANLKDCEGGPLPDEILRIFEDTWVAYKGRAPPYAY